MSQRNVTPYAGADICRRRVFEDDNSVQVPRSLARIYQQRYGRSLVDLALNRLAHGDVLRTRYGVRVQVRQDLGDDRTASRSEAYWPWAASGCRCWSMKTRGRCSHDLAARLFAEMENA